jgi:hypothetical protein
MRAFIAVLLTASALAGQAFAVDPPSCAVPDNLLYVDNNLNRVTTAVGKQHQLAIAVFGTGSSTLAGADGPSMAYPARLEAVLNQRLSNVMVRVATRTKSGQTAESMRRNMNDLLVAEKPNLVIWQTGTVDAIRRVELDEFRTALEAGVETLQTGGADVILMNMQYSPMWTRCGPRRSSAMSPCSIGLRSCGTGPTRVPLTFMRRAGTMAWRSESMIASAAQSGRW